MKFVLDVYLFDIRTDSCKSVVPTGEFDRLGFNFERNGFSYPVVQCGHNIVVALVKYVTWTKPRLIQYNGQTNAFKILASL